MDDVVRHDHCRLLSYTVYFKAVLNMHYIDNCQREYLFPLSTLERDDSEENDTTGVLIPEATVFAVWTLHRSDFFAMGVSAGAAEAGVRKRNPGYSWNSGVVSASAVG